MCTGQEEKLETRLDALTEATFALNKARSDYNDAISLTNIGQTIGASAVGSAAVGAPIVAGLGGTATVPVGGVGALPGWAIGGIGGFVAGAIGGGLLANKEIGEKRRALDDAKGRYGYALNKYNEADANVDACYNAYSL